MREIRVENPTTPETFLQAMGELGIAFPLACSQQDIGVLLDADGEELLTVDSAGCMPDEIVALLVANIAMVLNNAAGHNAIAALVAIEEGGTA
ncbi:hypothetical protein PCC82_02635 [Agrobacterium deltaense]